MHALTPGHPLPNTGKPLMPRAQSCLLLQLQTPSPRTTYLTLPVAPARSVEWSPPLWALRHAQAPTARCVQQALSKTIFKIQVDEPTPRAAIPRILKTALSSHARF